MPFGLADRPVENLNGASGERQITVVFRVLPSESPRNILKMHTFLASDGDNRAAPLTLNEKSVCAPAQKRRDLEIVVAKRFGRPLVDILHLETRLRLDTLRQ